MSPLRRRHGRRRAALCVLLVGLCSCGYRIVGKTSLQASEASALWISPVEDNAGEPLFGARLGAALAREAVDRALFTLSRETAAAQHLRVQVVHVSESAAAFRVGDVVKEYLLRAEAVAYLMKPEDELRWKGTGITAQREFAAGRDVNETEANKDAALELLARDLSREIMRRVTLVTVRR